MIQTRSAAPRRNSETDAARKLRGYLERIERLEEDRKGLADDIADIYKELVGGGFDKDAAKVVLKIRKGGADGLKTWQSKSDVVDTYLAALGMLSSDEHDRAPARAREIIEQFGAEIDVKTPPEAVEIARANAAPAHDPETGELIEGSALTEAEKLNPNRGDEDHAKSADVSDHCSDLIGRRRQDAHQEAERQPSRNELDDTPTESVADEISAPIEHPTPGSSPCAASDQTGGEVLPDAPPVAQFEPPVFLTKDSTAPKPELNPRCEKPATCKFSHHPQKITCGTCSTAWAIAQRKKAVPA